MKRLAAIGAVVGALLALIGWSSPSLLGFSPWHARDALGVAVGLGAKLACSGHFLTGQDVPEVIDDLASYSPVTRLLDLEVHSPRVSATPLGLARASTTYRPGIGCTLDIGDTTPLDSLAAHRLPARDAPWPRGDDVTSIELHAQSVAEVLLQQDNAAGRNTRALLLVRGGRVVAEAYADGIGTETPLLGFSMGKSVVAMLVGRVQYLGLLPEDEHSFDAGALFPPWHDDPRREIRLVHLLQMTSGLGWDETYAPGSDSTRMLFQAPSASEVALRSPAEHPPGTFFYYYSSARPTCSRASCATGWAATRRRSTSSTASSVHRSGFDTRCSNPIRAACSWGVPTSTHRRGTGHDSAC